MLKPVGDKTNESYSDRGVLVISDDCEIAVVLSQFIQTIETTVTCDLDGGI